MAEIQKSLQRTLFQGQYVFNYGGLVPEFLGGGAAPSPTPTPTPSITPTITPTASSTPVATPSPTATSTPTTTPTITPTNTQTPTLTPTKTSTPTPSPSPVVYDEYFGSGSTEGNACAAAETLQLYSNQPFFTFGQDLYFDSGLTNPVPSGVYLSAGDIVYFYDTSCGGLCNAVSCPVPSPTPSPTLTQTPTKTPTPTPTSTPTTFTAEYLAILSRASGLGYAAPVYSQQVLQNQLIVDLKAAGYWAKLGNMYMFKVDLTAGGSPQFTFLNWITPTNPSCSIQINAGGFTPPVHTPQGWRFTNENRMVLGSNVGSTINPINTTSIRNSEGTYVAAFVANSSTGNNMMWSTDNNGWNKAFYNTTAGHTIFRGIGLTDSFDFTGLGFKGATIDGVITSDTTIFFQNDASQTTKTKTGVDVGVGGGNIYLNFNGSNSNNSFSWTSGFWFSGAGLSSGDMPGFQTIITNYMNA